MIKKEKRDFTLMQYLRKNSRESLWKISNKTRIPISTIYYRLRQLEKNAILKYTILINFPAFGYQGHSFVSLKIGKINRKELLNFLETHSKVNTVYEINNGYDIFAEVVFKNMKGVEDFVEEIKNDFPIDKFHITPIIKSVKKEEFVGDLKCSLQ